MLANWVKENTTTTGTGTITLGGAVTGFSTFSSHIDDGDQVLYVIEDGSNREAGIGTFTATGTTLARTRIIETLVSGTIDKTNPSAITLSGSATVSISSSVETSLPVRATSYDNRIICGPIRKITTNFAGFAANKLYAVGFLLREGIDVDQLSFNLTVLQAGSNALLGIYDYDVTGVPGKLLISTVEIDTGTATGILAATISPTVHLPPGFYYSVIWANAAIDVGGDTTYYYGGMGVNAAGDTNVVSVSATKTYATTLPTDISAETWGEHTGVPPGIVARYV